MSKMGDKTKVGDNVSFKIIRGKQSSVTDLNTIKQQLDKINEALSILKGEKKK